MTSIRYFSNTQFSAGKWVMLPFFSLPVVGGLIRLIIIPLLPLFLSFSPTPSNAFSGKYTSRPQFTANADKIYDSSTIIEDTTWRGTIIVKGSVVIAPQSTLRIEPGTVVRFTRAVVTFPPRLVVMGRIQIAGTQDKPVQFLSNHADQQRGDWGGILLLSSEKRNLIEHTRIEGADAAITAHFSNITVKGLAIARSETGLLLRDSTALLTSVNVSGCNIALEARDSEVELRDSTISSNKSGIVSNNSTLAMHSVAASNNEQTGVVADDSRIRLNGCDLAGNSTGGYFKGGEGQITSSRFRANREAGLHLANARIKVTRSLIADNLRDGVRVDDGRSILWGNTFNGNKGFHIVNGGKQDVSAVQNWWGTADAAALSRLISDSARTPGIGTVFIYPWLADKPPGTP